MAAILCRADHLGTCMFDHGAKVYPADHDQALRGIRLRVERVLERPQVKAGDEGRPGASVEETDLHRVLRHNDDGLRRDRGCRIRDVHRPPEVDAGVEVEHRRPSEAVVVAIHEAGADQVLEPRHQRPQRVAAPRRGAGGEAANVVEDPGVRRRQVLRRYVVVGAGVGEGGVRRVGQLGGVVDVAGLP
ncbi:Os09g0265225 [Oryza sativa Japonica Group]|uniref:Os09g0265225 protein n=1 Tax=Oryza sativa subsp. japonica TaxID=39947 RepID=A0A0N7KQG2_ORYSJ|nr:Os09g0265225 [Oryza sativa Japonica Group]